MKNWELSLFIVIAINIFGIISDKFLGVGFREAKIDTMLYLLLFISIDIYMSVRRDSE